ncbi:MAG: methyltransferase domain-containing protein [Phycisphaerae bacterium]|nr:methyltransferase domain-containing protein [Phycisphaerae bacterium]
MTPETFASFPIRRQHWTVGGEPFELIWPADMDALLDDPRTRERFRKDEYMPYWATPWPSAALLAEHVLTHCRPGAGRAIDLGCGVGLVAIAAARAGWTVTAADYDADALKFSEENARLNGVTLAGTARVDWRTPFVAEPFDLVLASDVLYERRHNGPVARWIAAALAPDGLALVSDSNRGAAEGFPAIAAAAGLAVERLACEQPGPHGLLIRGAVYRLRHADAPGATDPTNGYNEDSDDMDRP